MSIFTSSFKAAFGWTLGRAIAGIITCGLLAAIALAIIMATP